MKSAPLLHGGICYAEVFHRMLEDERRTLKREEVWSQAAIPADASFNDGIKHTADL